MCYEIIESLTSVDTQNLHLQQNFDQLQQSIDCFGLAIVDAVGRVQLVTPSARF